MRPNDDAIRQALTLRTQGRRREAIALLRSVVQGPGADSRVLGLLGQLMVEGGRADLAEPVAREAGRLDPSDPRPRLLLGTILNLLRKFDEALPIFNRLVHELPGTGDVLLGLAAAQRGSGRLAESEATLRQAAVLMPSHPMPVFNLGVLLRDTGRVVESIALFRQAASLDPRGTNATREWALTLNYDPDADAAEIRSAHGAFARLLTPPAPLPPISGDDARPDPARPARPMRVGYLSGDLRTHSVAYFLEPILRGHDRTRFEVFVYSTNAQADETTERLRGHGAIWRQAGNLTDEAIARLIREDRVDVLIELGGLTMTGRLGVLAHRPAPLQITYLGYPNTTGLDAIDFRLVDAITDPPGVEPAGPESLARLPGCFVCYQPPSIDIPQETTLLDRDPGCFTFVSFNHLYKLNHMVLGLWAEVLRRAPGTRLVLKSRGLDDPLTRANILKHLTGVDPARVLLFDRLPEKASHLSMYRACDLALDTYPYNGTTTTCESLWMGVPVLTLSGQTHASRVGASLLHAVGLEELVATEPEGFVTLATGLALQRGRVEALSRRLRDGFLHSRLTDARGFMEGYQTLLLQLWCRSTSPPAC